MIKKAIFLVFALCIAAYCQGYRNPPAGIKTLMEAGVTPVTDDASACVLNPAGLVLIKQNQFDAGILCLFSETKYSGLTASSKKENDFALLGNLYFVMVPNNSDIRFGFGITSPYGQKTEWEKSFTENIWAYGVPYYGKMEFITFTPSIALPLNKNLSIGSGIDIHTSSLETKQSVPWSFITGTPDGIAVLKGDDISGSLRIGIHYHKEGHSVGFAWSSPFEMNYSGNFSMTNMPDPPPFSGIKNNVNSNLEIKFPEIYSLGYKWKGNKLSVQMGTEFVRYSCLKSMKVDAGPNSFLIPEMERDWKDVWTYSASLRYRINNKCDITAGIGFIESPVPDKTFDPLLPDADRFLYTIGTTIKIKSGLFSFFYMYNQFEKRNIQQGRFTDGIYKSSGSFVGCGYTAGI
jgi:long-chain fatty acid transport protein